MMLSVKDIRPPEEGVRLDRIDRPPWPPAREPEAEEPDGETAQGRHQKQAGDGNF